MASAQEIDDDPGFQRTFWVVQRVGWAILALAVLIALLFTPFSENIWRAVAIYMLILVVVRLAGRRTLGQLTAFDLVLLLIVSEASGNATLGGDDSLAAAAVVIITLIGLDIIFTVVKGRSKVVDKVIDGVPTILVAKGEMLHDVMRRARIEESDILSAVRASRGVTGLDGIEYVVLENTGELSIIPKVATQSSRQKRVRPG